MPRGLARYCWVLRAASFQDALDHLQSRQSGIAANHRVAGRQLGGHGSGAQGQRVVHPGRPGKVPFPAGFVPGSDLRGRLFSFNCRWIFPSRMDFDRQTVYLPASSPARKRAQPMPNKGACSRCIWCLSVRHTPTPGCHPAFVGLCGTDGKTRYLLASATNRHRKLIYGFAEKYPPFRDDTKGISFYAGPLALTRARLPRPGRVVKGCTPP